MELKYIYQGLPLNQLASKREDRGGLQSSLQPSRTKEPAILGSESSPCPHFFGCKNCWESGEMNHFIGEKNKAAVIWFTRNSLNSEGCSSAQLEPRSFCGLLPSRSGRSPFCRKISNLCVYFQATGMTCFKPCTFSLLGLLMTEGPQQAWFKNILTSSQQCTLCGDPSGHSGRCHSNPIRWWHGHYYSYLINDEMNGVCEIESDLTSATQSDSRRIRMHGH